MKVASIERQKEADSLLSSSGGKGFNAGKKSK